MRALILASILAVTAGNLSARVLTIKNRSTRTFEIGVMPQGFLAMSAKQRTRAVKNRFAVIKAGKQARLNLDGVEKIVLKDRRSPKFKSYSSCSLQDIETLDMREKSATLILTASDSYELKIGKLSILRKYR